jgi:cytochrome c553
MASLLPVTTPSWAAWQHRLSDEDMKNVAAWFASQKLKPAAAKDETKIALGQKALASG